MRISDAASYSFLLQRYAISIGITSSAVSDFDEGRGALQWLKKAAAAEACQLFCFTPYCTSK